LNVKKQCYDPAELPERKEEGRMEREHPQHGYKIDSQADPERNAPAQHVVMYSNMNAVAAESSRR